MISGLISKVLSEVDFKPNREAADQLYDMMNLRGSLLGIMMDGICTVADILNPLFEGRERMVVLAGIEEHYFTQLATLFTTCLHKHYPGGFILVNASVGGIYARLIEGPYPYLKMSKSILDSSINLCDSETDLENKILHCREENERIIMQMIELVSDRPNQKINAVRRIYKDRLK